MLGSRWQYEGLILYASNGLSKIKVHGIEPSRNKGEYKANDWLHQRKASGGVGVLLRPVAGGDHAEPRSEAGD
ncbi:hypothetical protein DSO57_1012783 [Entomophthora muscae]|uniref:Uncharacterized protein n=1 Tax=Entomophthora muscae TaxID=34485 RepID=A0ACC2UFH2_9FUNG|nr:hypothetical protein DSO57_1012783 [Entomophthora muscae]